MVFSSPFFIFAFLPVIILLVLISPKKLWNVLLLLASLYFYSWGKTSHLLILIASILINYFSGLLIDKSSSKKLFLGLAIAANLLLLAYLKYFNFFIENVNSVFTAIGLNAIEHKEVLLPIGISFFTFQAISYLVDLYRKQVPAQKSILDLALYISLFPQLIAGPIVRYASIADQLKARSISWQNAAEGIQRFIFGLSKKVIIANTMAMMADSIMDKPIEHLSPAVAWLGIISYTLQIYFDFSGYSDMAIGLGKIFGFNFPENFNYPYKSKSIKEFWRRWHISLSTWFRDYLYIPLGGNRLGKTRTYVNLIIVFLCTGFWHGASWSFVFWGLFHGAFLLIERAGFDNILQKIWKPVQVLYTLVAVMVGWVFFRIEDFANAWNYLSLMSFTIQPVKNNLNLNALVDFKFQVIAGIAVLYSLGIFRKLQAFVQSTFDNFNAVNAYTISFKLTKFGLSLALLYMSVLYLAANTYNPFIYFRF